MNFLRYKIYLITILAVIGFFGISAHADAAGCEGTGACYWVGGTGNWSDTSHWATESGGATTGSVPTAGDNVYFDSASNADAYTVTINAAAYCFNLNIANPASGVITLAGSSAFTISGSAEFASGMTNSYTGNITFNSANIADTSAAGGAAGIAFNSNGTRMYVVKNYSPTVYQYDLGTAWDVGTAKYNSVSLSISAQEDRARKVTFSSDGTKMYVVGATNKTVYQYTLSTAWDLSTASYATLYKSVSAQESNPLGLAFSPDGTNMYIVGAANNKAFRYILGTAWDVSTATYNSVSGTLYSSSWGIAFNSDGTKMYIVTGAYNVYQYTLGTAWDISGVSSAGYDAIYACIISTTYDVEFNSDGTKMYQASNTNSGRVYQYTLGTAWNISSASYAAPTTRTITTNGTTFASYVNFSGLDGKWQLQDAFATTQSITFSNGILDTNSQSVASASLAATSGTRVLNLGSTNWTITGNNTTIWYWSTSNGTMLGKSATITSNYSGSTGTRTIRMDNVIDNPSLSITAGTDTVYTYAAYVNNLNFTGFSGTWSSSSGALSIYGNLTLASGMNNSNTAAITMAATSVKNTNSQPSSPSCLSFNDDGTRMYVSTGSQTSIWQYDLITPWDTSTAYYSLSKTFSEASNIWGGATFNLDGTKMYIVDVTSRSVLQYNVSVPWDISTATYASLSVSVAGQDSSPRNVHFNSDGTKMYILGWKNGTVFQYFLSSAWDVSTATYSSIYKSGVGSNMTFAFNSDGTRMYVAKTSGTFYQYNLSSAWDVSTATLVSSKSVVAQSSNSWGIAFSLDGTKMYMADDSTNIFQYTLSSAWELSTANVDITSKTVTSNTKTLGSSITFNSSTGSWQLQDALTTTGTGLTLTAGTFDPNGQTVSMTGARTAAVTGAFSFYNFTRTGTAVATDALTFDSNVTISNLLTLTGNSATNKITVKSSTVGTQRTITAGSVSLTDVKFQDIYADGAAIPWTGTRLIDLGNNYNITFAELIYKYWVGGSGNWSDATNHWATESGGSPDAGNIPITDDEVIFDSASGANDYTVTINSAAYANDLTIGNPASGVITLAGSSALNIYGSLSLPVGLVNSYTGAITFGSTVKNRTISMNGTSLASSVTFNGPGGGWQLQDAFATTGALTFSNGTLDTNSKSVSSLTLTASSGTRILNLGSTNWTLTGNAATIWNWSTSSGTMAGKAATITSNYSGSTGTRTITMGSTDDNPSLSVTAGSDIVIISAASLRNLDFTGFSGTWSSSSGALSVYGNLTLSPTMTNSYTNTLTFAATSAKSVSSQMSTPYGASFSSDGTKMFVLGSNGTVYQYILGAPWDVSTATYSSLSKSVLAEESSPVGRAFSSDGTKMYIVGPTNDTVYQYTLSTPWDVSTASYAALSKSVTSQDSSPYGVTFSSDGTKMYILGYSNKTVYQYTLSSAWDVSSASYASLSKAVNDYDATSFGITFSSDGTKMYVAGCANDTIFQYALSTPWDVSTASYAALSKYAGAQDTSPYNSAFSSDGTRMYIAGGSGNIFQYVLGTAWDVSTANFSPASKTVTTNGKSLASAITFNSLYGSWQLADALSTTGIITFSNGILDTNNQSVSSLTLAASSGTRTLDLGSTNWTLTGNNTNIWYWSISNGTMLGRDATVICNYSGSTGTRTIRMYADDNNPSLYITAGSDIVYTYSTMYVNNLDFTGFSGTWSSSSGALSVYGDLTLSPTMTNSYTNILTFAATSAKSVSSQDSNPIGVTFSSDGTKMYIIGPSADTVYQYTLGTAWDVSTASYISLSKSVASQENNPADVIFSSDGTKMYVVGYTNRTVYQYSLGTAWDVSTASYVSLSKSVASEDSQPFGVTFSSDGTKMYILGLTNRTVYQYTLGTAWDVSTASYNSVYKSVNSQDSQSIDVSFSFDGTKMYIMGYTNKTVYQYTLGTPWDVSTASYDSIYKSVIVQESTPYSVTFSSDGTKMYVIGLNSKTVYQYALGTAWDVSTASVADISSAKTVTSNSKALNNAINFNGAGGVWQLQDNFTNGASYTTTFTTGTINLNGKDLGTGLFSTSNSNARTITGNGSITLTGVGTVWNSGTAANLTASGMGTIKFTDNSTSAKTFAGGGGTFDSLWNATAGTGTFTITGSNTFNNFHSDAGRTNYFTAGTTQTVGSLTAMGGDGNLITLASTATSPFYLIKSGSGIVYADYLSVSYSTVTPSAGIWYAGTNSADGGNNSGWIFGAPPSRGILRGDIKLRGNVKIK